MEKYTNVKKSDCKTKFAAEIVSEATDSNAVKVHIKARSNSYIEHPYWGKIVHDFTTMGCKKKVVLDSEHGVEIGYFKNYTITDYGLEIDGIIFPDEKNPDNEANRVIYNLTNGIPMEASIDFSGDYDIEELVLGQKAMINNLECEGPMVVIRNWQLKAVALCKFGADDSTSTEKMSKDEMSNPKNVIKSTESEIVKSEELSKTVETEILVTGNECKTDSEIVKTELEQPAVVEEQVVEANNEAKVATDVISTDEVAQVAEKADETKVLHSKIEELQAQLKALAREKDELSSSIENYKKLSCTKPLQVMTVEEVVSGRKWQELVKETSEKFNISYDKAFFKAKEIYADFYNTKVMSK